MTWYADLMDRFLWSDMVVVILDDLYNHYVFNVDRLSVATTSLYSV